MRSDRGYLRPEWVDFTPERSDLMHREADLGPVRAKLGFRSPWGLEGGGGWTGHHQKFFSSTFSLIPPIICHSYMQGESRTSDAIILLSGN